MTNRNDIMKTKIIHHPNEDFTSEIIETHTLNSRGVTNIEFSKPKKL
jgi:hypothetical protein